MNDLAPIILFVYNRPEHTLRCLNSLYNNYLAEESTLYIFCDGTKDDANELDIAKNNQVQEIIQQKQWCKEVLIKKQPKNIGLRNSVIAGVNEVFEKYNKVIILEDDLVLSNYFLDYMNKGLQLFENNLEVSQISGHSFKLDVKSLKEDAYFLPLTTTWGWATWKRVWNEIDFEARDYKKVLSTPKAIRAFNLDNSYNYYTMLRSQLNNDKKISSWGIMFWLHSFKKNYKILFPKYTLVTNIGLDGTGMHKANETQVDDFKENNQVTYFPDKVLVNEHLFKLLKNKLRRSEFTVKRRLYNLFKNLLRK